MTNRQLHEQLATKILQAYRVLETNVDPQYRTSEGYNTTYRNVLREFKRQHPTFQEDEELLNQIMYR